MNITESTDKEILCKTGFDFLKIWYNKSKEANIYQIKAEESLKELRDFEDKFLNFSGNPKMFNDIFNNYNFKSDDNEIICDSAYNLEQRNGELFIRYRYKNEETWRTSSVKWFFEKFLFSGEYKFYPKEK